MADSTDVGSTGSSSPRPWYSCHATPIAGAVASGASKAMLFPIDTFKARLQSPLGLSAFQWTLRGLFRGVVVKLSVYPVYQSLYMTAYVHFAQMLALPLAVHHESVKSGGRAPSILWYPLCGAGADLAASLVRNPMEAAKQRLQTGVYASSAEAARHFVREPASFYSRVFIPQTVMHDMPYSGMQWTLYEVLRRKADEKLVGRDEAALSPLRWVAASLGSGAAAAAVASIATTPLDAAKTRLVCRVDNVHIGIRAFASECGALARELASDASIRSRLGASALARIAHVAPSSGLYLLFYEQIRFLLM